MSRQSETGSFATVVKLPHQWFALCESHELGTRPLARRLQGTPLVLFRGPNGKPAALVDRCPHRNVPLSLGQVEGGQLQCGYHGWRFAADGQCTAVPGLLGEPGARSRCATAHACREQDGLVWVYSTASAEPQGEPYRFPYVDTPGYTTVRRKVQAPSTLHAALENTLDVPHTAYLHGGFFRTQKTRRDIDVVVRRTARSVEAEYVGEPAPTGLVGRLLAPGGGVVEHFDRFLLPSLAQVEYRLGASSHLLVTSAMTPVDDFATDIFAVVTFKLPLPAVLVKPFLLPVALHIFDQDARVLAAQTRTLHHFGSEAYASTELDVLGPAILRLLQSAGRPRDAGAPEAPPVETRLKVRL